TRLALATLSTEESVRIACELLATSEIPAPLRDLVERKAEGNPFFIEEMLRWLGEVGVVRREGARVVFERSGAETLVPDTIQDLIMSRIDRLPEGTRQMLRVASIIGREFPRRLLEHVLESAADGERLRQLRSLELIYERRAFPEIVYRFKHALTHEVAYASLPPDERRTLHRRIASALEAIYSERLREYAGILADHYSAAEDWDRALVYLVQAAEVAARAFATREALALYDQALAAAERIPSADPS